MDKLELLKDARLTSALLELRGYLALNPTTEEVMSALQTLLRIGASALGISKDALSSKILDEILTPGEIESFKELLTKLLKIQNRSEGDTK